MYKLDEPMNANERYLHHINVRLDILIRQFSSFLEVYAKQHEVPTEDNTHQEKEIVIGDVKIKKPRKKKEV